MPVSDLAQASAPLAAHAALLYASVDEFVTWALRFVDAGLDEDEPVLVSAPRPEISFLRARMNGRAHRVSWADITRIGANPGRIIPHVHAFASARLDPQIIRSAMSTHPVLLREGHTRPSSAYDARTVFPDEYDRPLPG